MAGTEGFAQAQAHGALDQERSAQLGAFGDEQPAQSFSFAGIVHRAGNRGRDFGVQVCQVELGRFGAAAGGQVRDDLVQLGIVVQGYQFRLEQVLGHDEAGEVGLGFERRVSLHQCVELGVRLVGDLVQALGAQAWAFCGGRSGHEKSP